MVPIMFDAKSSICFVFSGSIGRWTLALCLDDGRGSEGVGSVCYGGKERKEMRR